jgi:hypothetical protein
MIILKNPLSGRISQYDTATAPVLAAAAPLTDGTNSCANVHERFSRPGNGGRKSSTQVAKKHAGIGFCGNDCEHSHTRAQSLSLSLKSCHKTPDYSIQKIAAYA